MQYHFAWSFACDSQRLTTGQGTLSLYIHVKMSSSGNAYAAEPAFPILAHTLLSSRTTTSMIPEQPDEPDQSAIWNLRKDIEEAFEGPSSVFRYGRVIGFSKLKNRAQEEDDHDFIGQVRCISFNVTYGRSYQAHICIHAILEAISAIQHLHPLHQTPANFHSSPDTSSQSIYATHPWRHHNHPPHTQKP